MELYGRVRHAVRIEGLSNREAARRFGIDPRTVAKMLVFSVPPGYRRRAPAKRPKLDPFIGIIDQILEDDKSRPAKQRHTSKRIFESVRDEHGYAGGLNLRRLSVFNLSFSAVACGFAWSVKDRSCRKCSSMSLIAISSDRMTWQLMRS